MTAFRTGAVSHAGRVRDSNQDRALVVDDRLFAVADGMGGHQGGEVASEMALDVLESRLEGTTTRDLVKAMWHANAAVFDRAKAEPELKGMGTTLCAVASVGEGDRLGIANVGDSRIYRLRGGTLDQLTEDHSLVADLVRDGRITLDEAASHPQRNVVTRALGIDRKVQIDSWEVDAVAGDRYLLCSDGLFNEVELNRIAATVRRLDDPVDAAKELVRLANEGGGRDNITCVVVHVLEGATGRDDGDGEATGVMAAIAADEPEPADDADPADDGDPADVDGASDAVADDLRAERPRRFTWRVLGFSTLLVALFAAILGAVGWYARYTYFVGLDGDTVAIYQGRPGGFLWFDPTVEEATDLDRADLPEAAVDDLESGRDQATIEDARRYVANLADQVEQATTSTTAPPATTAGAGGGRSGGSPGGGGAGQSGGG